MIGGFSMGAVMSYAVGLGAGRPSPRGILAFSGFIPTVDGWAAELDSRPGLPVLIHHGGNDPVISVEFARAGAADAGGGRARRRDLGPTPVTGCRPRRRPGRRLVAGPVERRQAAASCGSLSFRPRRELCRRRRKSRPAGRPGLMRTCVRALGQPREGSGHAGVACPVLGESSGPHVRRARGARHPLPRGRGELGASTRVPSARGCRFGGRSTRTGAAPMPALLLLRPPDPRVPRPQRARGLRARDRRQGQRPGAWCAPSWRGRRGRASTSRSGRTPTRTSGSRAATG